MRCKLSTPGSPEYIPPVTPSISAAPDPSMPPSPSPSPSTLYLRTLAVAQSSTNLSGGGGETRIFPPQRLQFPSPMSRKIKIPCCSATLLPSPRMVVAQCSDNSTPGIRYSRVHRISRPIASCGLNELLPAE